MVARYCILSCYLTRLFIYLGYPSGTCASEPSISRLQSSTAFRLEQYLMMVIPDLSTSSFLSRLEDRFPNASTSITLLKMVSNVIVERLSSPFIWMPLLFVAISMLYSRLTAILPPPTELPWIGKCSNKMFAETRAHLTSFNNVRQWLNEGYNKVRSCSQSLRM
jgi:hypothetical protein